MSWSVERGLGSRWRCAAREEGVSGEEMQILLPSLIGLKGKRLDFACLGLYT